MSLRPGVLVALLGASCVDAARPAARAARPAVVRQRAAEDARERARREALPRLEPDRTPIDENQIRRADDPRRAALTEGVGRYVFGPMRAEARGDAVTMAPEVPAAGSFVVAARAALAWVFVTDQDEVFASAAFLGPLRRIGSLRCAPLPMDGPGLHRPAGYTPSAARVVLWSDGAAAWTDGVSLHFERDDRTRALAWRDERHGARIVDGAIESTDDGGRTWRAVRGAPGLPMELAGREDALLALTTEGTFRVDEGSVAATTAVPGDPPPDLRYAVRSALLDAARERYERAPRQSPSGCTRAVRPAPSAADELTPVAVSFPVVIEPSGWTYNPSPVERRAPLGPPERTEAALDASVMVTSAEQPGGRTAFAWRAVDARGRYAARAEVTVPEALRPARWRALTATREALLLQGGCEPADPDVPCAGLVRVSPAGAALLPGTSQLRELVLAASGDDGSMAVLGVWRTPGAAEWARAFSRFEVPVAAAVVVAPDGAVAARIPSDDAAGLGEREGAWGVASAHDGAWWWRGAGGRKAPFGQWRADPVHPCTGPSAGASRLHLNRGDRTYERPLASFTCSGDCGPIAQAEGFTLRRRAGEAPCVERVRGVHTESRGGADGEVDQRQSVCFLSRGRMGVFIDRGDVVGFTPATVHANTFDDAGY